MPQLKNDSADTIITDPPYALQFMGKAWDKVLPAKEIWIECLRVVKPGAMMLVFGGDRTHHRLMVDIEDAGWEIRTCVYWVFGQGFPKSANIAKQIDRKLGAKRKVIGIDENFLKRNPNDNQDGIYDSGLKDGIEAAQITAPATPEAQLWDGWGTGLKPAAEIIVLAMAPLDGSFAESALKHGVAGLAIDKSRILVGPEGITKGGCTKVGGIFGSGNKVTNPNGHPQGRYPSNLLLSHSPECRQVGVKKVKGDKRQGLITDTPARSWKNTSKAGIRRIGHADPDGTETVPAYECAVGCPCGHVWPTEKLTPCPECGCRKTEWLCAVRMLDEQSGILKSGGGDKGGRNETAFFGSGSDIRGLNYNPDSGGASRFFKQFGYGDESMEIKEGKEKGMTKSPPTQARPTVKPPGQKVIKHNSAKTRFKYTAKASRNEREQGLKGHIPCVKCGGLDTDWHLDERGEKVKCIRNDHPTVKPQAIMDYLCKLTMTPTGGTVLDPFAGTGKTALACLKLGRKCISIDSEERYCEISKWAVIEAECKIKDLTKQGRLWDE